MSWNGRIHLIGIDIYMHKCRILFRQYKKNKDYELGFSFCNLKSVSKTKMMENSMNRIYIVSLLLTFLIWMGCGAEKGVTLEPGTPAYDLAKELAKKVPELDPDENKVLVKTNDFVVTTGEILQMIFDRMGNNHSQLSNRSEEQLRKIFNENAMHLAEKKLLLTAATNAGVKVDETEFTDMMDRRQRRYGGEERYRQMLESSGIPYDLMTQELREGLMIQHYLEDIVADDSLITEAEIAEQYEKDFGDERLASVRHILLRTQGKSEEEKAEIRKKMEGLLERARSGEDFAALAKEYSEDPGSKMNGGLYENFEKGTMVEPFEDAAFSVPIGEISDIVETSYGYHILKIVDRKKDERSIEELRPMLISKIKEEKKKSAIENLKTEAGLESFEV